MGLGEGTGEVPSRTRRVVKNHTISILPARKHTTLGAKIKGRRVGEDGRRRAYFFLTSFFLVVFFLVLSLGASSNFY